jgi:hypothetical protein
LRKPLDAQVKHLHVPTSQVCSREALMAKEQRSTKEKRKPKKPAADKKGGKK